MDFYIILGVRQDATAAEISRAYRRLSRRFHPGINPGDRMAEQMFRRISEAYETLSDPGRRRLYDAGVQNANAPRVQNASLRFTEFDFTASVSGMEAATFSELFADVLHPRAGRDDAEERGLDIHAAVTVDFAAAMRGVERQIVVTRQIACTSCRGSGQILTAESRCTGCNGTGTIRSSRGHMVFSKLCPDCNGTGRQHAQPCGACGATGRTVRSEAVTAWVPPGADDGMRLRIQERGHAGRHGGISGDLYVTVNVQPHPFFHRNSDDLWCVVPVAVHEAVLGGTIEVPTLDGPVPLRIPPGTQGGQRFRMARRGVPGLGDARGDLIVEVKLVLPESVDDRSRELMREFGERNSGNVRRQLFEQI
jgi:molecular chaperone DnaJ